MNNQWYHETLYKNYGQRFEMDAVLFEAKTDFQHLVIFENQQFERVMALDGVIQTTTRDEHIYHEMMVHVPILAHGNVKKVLIVGGGDGGILREVIKHAGVQQVTMVEIDAAVVEMSKEYLPSISNGAFEDARLNLIIADGMDFVKNTQEKFDVIITDSTDPIGPAEVLFTDDFYSAAKNCLNQGGIVSSQNGASFLQEWELAATHRRLSKLYQDASFYLASVPTYIGGFMSLAWATDETGYRQLPIETIQQRFLAHPFKTSYYNPAIHVASFALPQKIVELMANDCVVDSAAA
tara:strand:- start:515 stop:1396 length:882 start_codon:yes stop_codon:yes gene_type:complete